MAYMGSIVENRAYDRISTTEANMVQGLPYERTDDREPILNESNLKGDVGCSGQFKF